MLWLLGTPGRGGDWLPALTLAAEHLGWQSTFFVMAMLTVPVLIFVRVGLCDPSGGESGTSQTSWTNGTCRTARAVCQPALLDHLHL